MTKSIETNKRNRKDIREDEKKSEIRNEEFYSNFINRFKLTFASLNHASESKTAK